MSAPSFTIHPAADLLPMMDSEELHELAVSIQEHGQRLPIVIHDGVLIDGRNRLAACKLANVEPIFTTLPEGRDPEGYIYSANVLRRHLTKGQKAMGMAIIYPEPEKGGRGKKGTATNSLVSGEFTQQRLSEARFVLRYSRSLAESVVKGITPLDQALATAKQQQQFQISNDAKLTRLRDSAPDLAESVKEERLTIDEAIAALNAREKGEREACDRGHRAARDIIGRFVDAVSSIESAIECGATIILEPALMDQYVKAHALFMKQQGAVPHDRTSPHREGTTARLRRRRGRGGIPRDGGPS